MLGKQAVDMVWSHLLRASSVQDGDTDRAVTVPPTRVGVQRVKAVVPKVLEAKRAMVYMGEVGRDKSAKQPGLVSGWRARTICETATCFTLKQWRST